MVALVWYTDELKKTFIKAHYTSIPSGTVQNQYN